MQAVKIYTTRFCPFCIRAKHLLASKGVAFEEVACDGDRNTRLWLQQETGQSTVPQIWIGDTHVGGCDDLYALERRNELEELLNRG